LVNFDEEDYDNTKDVEEPMHRVSNFVMKMCIVYQKSLLPLKSLATNFLLYTQILSIKFHVFLFYLRSEGKSGILPKIDPNFNVSFPTTVCSPTFHKNERAAL
jgi:hypothetical protein